MDLHMWPRNVRHSHATCSLDSGCTRRSSATGSATRMEGSPCRSAGTARRGHDREAAGSVAGHVCICSGLDRLDPDAG